MVLGQSNEATWHCYYRLRILIASNEKLENMGSPIHENLVPQNGRAVPKCFDTALQIEACYLELSPNDVVSKFGMTHVCWTKALLRRSHGR